MSERAESNFERSSSSSSSSSSPESSQEITMTEIEIESTIEDANAYKTKDKNAKEVETNDQSSGELIAENSPNHKLKSTPPLLSSTSTSTLHARQQNSKSNLDEEKVSKNSSTYYNKSSRKESEIMSADQENRHNEQLASYLENGERKQQHQQQEKQEEKEEEEEQEQSEYKETEQEHPSCTSSNVSKEAKNNYNTIKKMMRNEHDIRQTQEYLAAWDLELWKAVQADRFRGQMQKYKEKALNELNHLIDVQKQKAQQETEQRMREVVEREAKANDARSQLDERERRLRASEQEVQRMKRSLIEAEHRAEEEIRLQVRRANDELRHKLTLMQERVKAADLQAQRADERQRQAQREYIELYEEFARFRTRQVTGSLRTNTAAGSSTNMLPHSATEPIGISDLGLLLPNTMVNNGDQAEYATSIIAACELRLAKLKVEHAESLRLVEEKYGNKLTNMNEQLRQVEEKNKQLIAAIARRREQLQSAKRELQMYKNGSLLLLRSKEENTQEQSKGHKTGLISSRENDKMTDVHLAAFDHQIDGIGTYGRQDKYYINALSDTANKDNESCNLKEHQNNKNANGRTKMKKTVSANLAKDRKSHENLTSKKPTTINNSLNETFTQRQLLQDEISRLQRERKTLICESNGAINDHDEIIKRVDGQIKLLSRELMEICEIEPVVEAEMEEDEPSLIIINNNNNNNNNSIV